MGILKKIGKAVTKAERAYDRTKKESKPIVRAGTRVLDWVIPPPKKKGKSRSAPSSRMKTVKIGGCSCKCPK